MRVKAEQARVLITVKTTPMPSNKYGDTVCVAGIRVDGGRAEWIRLYPIDFRWLDGEHKFRKYDLIDVEVRRRHQDSRPESYTPTRESIRIDGHLEDWRARQPVLQRVPRTTTCALRAAAGRAHSAPSLGMIGVSDFRGFEFEDHPGWNESELRKLREHAQTGVDLFGASNAPPPLKAPPLKVRYKYKCEESECPGHVGQILDWELTALQNRSRGSLASLKTEIRAKFGEQMFQPGKVTSLYMGNFEDPKKRQNFSVLGIHYPSAGIGTSRSLFELDGDNLIE